MEMLHDLFTKLLREYAEAYDIAWSTEKFSGPISDVMKAATKQVKNSIDAEKYLVKGSIGTGRWSSVPWIAVMKPEITQSSKDGKYIVYLLNKDTKELYLTFNQGITKIAEENGGKKREEKYLRIIELK